jgi:hypothetical protein
MILRKIVGVITPPKQYIFFPRLANVKFDFGNNIGDIESHLL